MMLRWPKITIFGAVNELYTIHFICTRIFVQFCITAVSKHYWSTVLNEVYSAIGLKFQCLTTMVTWTHTHFNIYILCLSYVHFSLFESWYSTYNSVRVCVCFSVLCECVCQCVFVCLFVCVCVSVCMHNYKLKQDKGFGYS